MGRICSPWEGIHKSLKAFFLSGPGQLKKGLRTCAKCTDPDPAHVQCLIQGPVVQSIVSFMSSLVVKMFTVLVSTIPNSQVFLLKKCE